jgi:hypothetical protein
MVDTVVAVGTAEVDRVVVAGPIVVVAPVVAAIVAAHMADSDMEAVAKFHPFQRYTIHYQSSVYLE